MTNTPTYSLPPYTTGIENTGRNVLPHILRNKEYDLEWLLWAVQQKYLDKKTLTAISQRIKELTNG